MSNQKYYIVSAEALPEVFVKVAEARRMLQVGEAATVGEAARMVGISRSAFYKYKDAVQPFQDMKAGHIITFYALYKKTPENLDFPPACCPTSCLFLPIPAQIFSPSTRPSPPTAAPASPSPPRPGTWWRIWSP